MLNTQLNGLTIDEIGDEHVGTSYDTPMKADAFDMDDNLKDGPYRRQIQRNNGDHGFRLNR